MDAAEKRLAEQTTAEMAKADAAVTELVDIMRGKDKARLDGFVKEKLYANIDPVTELVGKLADLVLWDAEHEGAFAWAYGLKALRVWRGGLPIA